MCSGATAAGRSRRPAPHGRLDPVAELRGRRLPLGQPAGEVLARLGDARGGRRASAAPAGTRRRPCAAAGRERSRRKWHEQRCQAATGRVRGYPGNRAMDVGFRELDPGEPARLQPHEERLPAPEALPVGEHHGRARCAEPSQNTPIATCTARLRITPRRALSRSARRGSGRGSPSRSAPAHEGRQLRVRRLVGRADRRGREGVPAQLLGGRRPVRVDTRCTTSPQAPPPRPSPSAGSARHYFERGRLTITTGQPDLRSQRVVQHRGQATGCRRGARRNCRRLKPSCSPGRAQRPRRLDSVRLDERCLPRAAGDCAQRAHITRPGRRRCGSRAAGIAARVREIGRRQALPGPCSSHRRPHANAGPPAGRSPAGLRERTKTCRVQS